MKLESVSINRFRSIESGELADCGGFNVLIGKNNSGKSNILSAIHAFFACMQGGNVVTRNPPIRKEIDFFERKTQSPIEITLTFSLLPTEMDALTRDIVAESPQMKNAMDDGFDPSLRLSTTISIAPPPDGFGFVSKIALIGATKPGAKRPAPEKILMSVSNNAASELYKQLSRSDQLSQDEKSLRTAISYIDKDALDRLKSPESYDLLSPRHMPIETFLNSDQNTLSPNPQSSRLLQYFSRNEISDEIFQKLESMANESTSPEEFRRTVGALITTVHEEGAAVQGELIRNKIGTFAGKASSIPNYVQNLLRRISELKVHYLREQRKAMGEDEAARLLSLKMTRGGSKILCNIQETVSALLGVQIDAFESSSLSRRGETTAEMDVDNFLVEVNGSGIREALRIVLDFEFEHPNILLIEEPETHLHPSLETGMMRYLKRISSDCQVFIATHSTNFLDTGEMKNIYLVSKPDSTRIQLVDYEDAEAQIPRELGIRLSSLFMFDRIIFVEGPSDETILREWASTLGVNLSQSNVGFIHMRGARNFTHFAAEATISFLTKRQVQMWFIMDRDERDSAEIDRLKEIAGENAVVKVLERREIENYLICHRAIIEFIGLKRGLSGNRSEQGLPTESDVINTIEGCAEKLKQIAIDKRVANILCRPVYPSTERLFESSQETAITDRVADEIRQLIEQLGKAKSKAEDVYKEQYEYVDRVWQSDKLAIVPGDLLLDMMCQEYGVRFKKDRDGERLAALMNEDEIAMEIGKIIREIGSERSMMVTGNRNKERLTTRFT